MDDVDNQNQNESVCCCPPMAEESEPFKKLKPILIGGIICYIVLLLVDIFYLYDDEFVTFIILIMTLCFLTFNRCFMVFPWYTLFSILLVFQSAIPGCGVIIQNKFENESKSKCILKFVIYIFMIIFSGCIFYFGFTAYKEAKYCFEQRIASNPQLIPSYMVARNNNDYNNNYNSNNNSNNNYNNNNQSSNRGFVPFSGRGYAVGGS